MIGRTRPRPPRGPRLSVVRIAIATVLVAASVAGTVQFARHVLAPTAPASSEWFAPYVDVTLTPAFDFQDPGVNPRQDVVLAFVVAGADDPCQPSWGGAYDLDEASTALDLDRRIARLRQRGGDVVVSFGGVANEELGRACDDQDQLTAAYRAVVERYDLTAIDLDLEGAALDATTAAGRGALERRAAAVAALQAERRDEGSPLEVWLTVPLSPQGLLPDAVAAVDQLVAGGVDLTGTNVMAMDYGPGRPAETSMVQASIDGLDAAARQIRRIHRIHGIVLTESESYARLGVTPMIGQNDYATDRLELDDARSLVDRGRKRGIRRFSMWSLNRDAPCAGNVDPTIADNNCSGTDQAPLAFSAIFATGGGRATPWGRSGQSEQPTSNSRTSERAEAAPHPYDDWRPRREYEAGAKVVWHQTVYQAEWWNVSVSPDAPVKNPWDSPWRIIGPVLAGDAETSDPPTAPPGSAPAWKTGVDYDTGDRVQFEGRLYRASWWTRGEEPGADVDNPWESPWEPVPPPSPAGS